MSRSKDGKDIYCKPCKQYFTQQWKLKYPDKLKSGKKKSDHGWYTKNKVKKLDTNKKWTKKNIDYCRDWFRNYKKDREQRDPIFKLKNRLRTRLWYALKKIKKSESIEKHIGCSNRELKSYLESKFQPGMSWDNYGEWHVDHIKPLAFFDLRNSEQLKQACHYTNLQPLWAKDNLAKSDKLAHHS